MPIQHFENLKKSMSLAEATPELLPNLMEELRFFFQMLRVKLESGDSKMRRSAADDLKELKGLLEKHPLIHPLR